MAIPTCHRVPSQLNAPCATFYKPLIVIQVLSRTVLSYDCVLVEIPIFDREPSYVANEELYSPRKQHRPTAMIMDKRTNYHCAYGVFITIVYKRADGRTYCSKKSGVIRRALKIMSPSCSHNSGICIDKLQCRQH